MILWASFVFGNMLVLSSVLSFSFFFSLTYYFYFKEKFSKFAVKSISIYTLALGLFVLLSFWIFYTSVIELSVAEYYRAKINPSIVFNMIPNFNTIVEFIVGVLQIDWFPNDIKAPGLPEFLHRSYNAVAIFPLILLSFMSRRSKLFWEFSFKTLTIIFIVHLALQSFPIYKSVFGVISSNSKQLITMYTTPYVCHIGLLAIYLFSYNKDEIRIQKPWGRFLQKGIAAILILLYGGLSIFSLATLLFPELIANLFQWGTNLVFGNVDSNYSIIAAYNILIYIQKGFHWYSFPFYFLNVLFLILFLKNKWLNVFIEKPRIIASFMLINAILMSWTVYPMNMDKTPWEEVKSELPHFKQFDRFYYIGQANDLYPKDFKSYNERNEMYGGPIESLEAYTKHGYAISPYLNLHGHRSFSTKAENEFLLNVFNNDGKIRLNNIRSLVRGPLVTSDLLDMGAVSYYYSRTKIKNLRWTPKLGQLLC